MIVNDDNGRLSGVRFVIVFHKVRMVAYRYDAAWKLMAKDNPDRPFMEITMNYKAWTLDK